MKSEKEPIATDASLFDLTAQFGVPPWMSKLLGLRATEKYCRKLPVDKGLAACVDQVMMDHGLQVDHIKAAAQCIPKKGALLITANHPTGILDGALMFCALLSRRNDVLIVANDLLYTLPVLGDYIIPIQKLKSSDVGGYRALLSIRRAWKRNGCVVVFPAGTVSHWQWKTRAISDAPWTTSIQSFAAALKVAEYRATIELKNPLWFHLCAAVSRKARTALLLWVFLSARRNMPIHAVVLRNMRDFD